MTQSQKMNSAGEAIFEAHVAFELEQWRGKGATQRLQDEVDAVWKWADQTTLETLVSVDTVRGAAERLARLADRAVREADEAVIWDEPGAWAASVFLAPAYLRLLLPAYDPLEDAPGLPLYAYSAVGVLDGELVAPAIRVDPDIRQDPFRFDIEEVARTL